MPRSSTARAQTETYTHPYVHHQRGTLVSTDSDSSNYYYSSDNGDYPTFTPPTSPGSSHSGATPPACASSATSTTSILFDDEQEKVPRPPNCFILFRSDYHKTHALSAHESGSDLSKKATQAWRQISPDERAVWERRAAERKREHLAMYPRYKYRPQAKGQKAAAAAAAASRKAVKKARAAAAKASSPRSTRSTVVRPSTSPAPVAVQLGPATSTMTIACPQPRSYSTIDVAALGLAQPSSPAVSSVPLYTNNLFAPSPVPTFSLEDHLLIVPSPGTESVFVSDEYLLSQVPIMADLDCSLPLGGGLDYSNLMVDNVNSFPSMDAGVDLVPTLPSLDYGFGAYQLPALDMSFVQLEHAANALVAEPFPFADSCHQDMLARFGAYGALLEYSSPPDHSLGFMSDAMIWSI